MIKKFLIGFFFSFLICSPVFSATWYNGNWKYRAEIEVLNSTTTIENLPIEITIDTKNLILNDQLLPNCNDFVMTESDGLSLIDFYLVNTECYTNTTTIYFKTPSLPQNTSQKFFLYYGNKNVTSTLSNWDNVFLPLNEVLISSSTNPTPRWGHRSIYFKNKFWLLGGRITISGDIGYSSEIWNSDDGINWTQQNNGNWSGRTAFGLVEFNNKLWLFGGNIGSSGKVNDVWNSDDGINWTQITNDANWSDRSDFAYTVFNNKIWLFGGGANYTNDVWNSDDGINWTQITNDADWSDRGYFSAVTFKDKMYIMGGYYTGSIYLKDVWSSLDGVNWNQETDDAWPSRYLFNSVVALDKIWVFFGIAGSYRNDIWYSDNGNTWFQMTSTMPVRNFTSLMTDGKKFILDNGYNGTIFTDHWQFMRPFIYPEPSVVVTLDTTTTTEIISANDKNTWFVISVGIIILAVIALLDFTRRIFNFFQKR